MLRSQLHQTLVATLCMGSQIIAYCIRFLCVASQVTRAAAARKKDAKLDKEPPPLHASDVTPGDKARKEQQQKQKEIDAEKKRARDKSSGTKIKIIVSALQYVAQCVSLCAWLPPLFDSSLDCVVIGFVLLPHVCLFLHAGS